MSLFNCPECGGRVSDKAHLCPHCGYPVEKQELDEIPESTTSTNASDNSINTANGTLSVVAVVLCVGVAIFLIVLANKPSTNSRQNTKTTYNTSSYNTKDYSSKDDSFDWEYYEKRNSALKITVNKVSNNGSYSTCDGSIKNNGDTTYEFIKVKGAFKDSSGNVVDTDWTYAVGGEGLAPGETTTFHLSVKNNSSIKDCKITFME